MIKIYYNQDELDILESCLDMAIIQLEEKKIRFDEIAQHLDRDIKRTLELKNKLKTLSMAKKGSISIFTRYEAYLLIEIICDVLNYYKDQDYPRDTISRIMTAQKPLFDNIINEKSPSIFLARREERKVS